MFSDFREHVLAVPQISPRVVNMPFDGPGADEDFGREQHTGNPADRYAFRTSPLRNLVLQRGFMHNGAFTSIEAAVRHHLDPFTSARGYDPVAQHLDSDLIGTTGPIEPLLERLDPMLAAPAELSREQFDDLIAFLREGLLDPRADPVRLQKLVPERVPSGSAMLRFEFAPR